MGASSDRPDPPAAALDAIRKIEREKDEFLSLVSHELKTPLTPLKSVAQLIRMRLRKARSGERALDMDALEKSLASIERQVDRMDRLVTDLLEVTRIGRGRFHLGSAELDLVPLVRDVVGRFGRTEGDEERHTFEVDAPASLMVKGDRPRLEGVLLGLVGNAVKFSPRGGAVRVRVEERDGHAIVTVTDEGIGMTAEELPTFGTKPFVRGVRAHGYAGVGVGLYLARLVAEGHGGRLELESQGDEKGTTVRLILPL